MTAKETVALLAGLVERRRGFLHVRFGDGDVFFTTGTGPKLTADGEEWTPQLQQRLRSAWRRLAAVPDLLVGDVESYEVSDGCEEQWQELRAEAEQIRGGPLPLVHIEALRCGFEYALPFYRAVAADPRRKVFVGPVGLAGAARMLGANHRVVPLRVAHGVTEQAVGDVIVGRYELALFAAGRGGKLMQAELATLAPSLCQVDVGSGLDLLFDGVRRGTDAGVDVDALRVAYRAAGLEVR